MKVYFTTTAKGQHPHAAPHLIELEKKPFKVNLTKGIL